MALGPGVTQLADVYTPEVVDPAVFDAALAQSKIITSDAISVDPGMSADLTGRGLIFTGPAYVNIADSDTPALIPNDVYDDIGTPEKIASYLSMWHRLARDKGWASMDVVTDISGADPIAQVAAQYGGAVAKWREVSLMNMLKGVMNATVSGTTLYKVIGAEATGSVTTSTVFNPDSLIDLMVDAGGDTFDGGTGYTLFVHPKTYGAMVKADLIDGEKISSQGITIPTYLGIKVVSTRVAPTRAGTTSGTLYTSYLIKDGTISMGVGRAKHPTELQREADRGNSGGADVFWVRDVFGFAIRGFSYTGTPDPELSDSALATVGNWTRNLAPEQIGIAAIVHNV